MLRLIFDSAKFLFSSIINVIPFKIVPLGSYTPMETLFPILVVALKVFNRYGLRLVCYTPGQTVNQVFFIKTSLKGSVKRIIRVRPDIAVEWMLYHDNAPRHTALSVTKFLTSKCIPVVPSPPIQLTSTPMAFSFFLNLKISSKDVISGL